MVRYYYLLIELSIELDRNELFFHLPILAMLHNLLLFSGKEVETHGQEALECRHQEALTVSAPTPGLVAAGSGLGLLHLLLFPACSKDIRKCS